MEVVIKIMENHELAKFLEDKVMPGLCAHFYRIMDVVLSCSFYRLSDSSHRISDASPPSE